MSEQITEWFPGDVMPVRVGMYERKYKHWRGLAARDYWDGEKWIPCFDGYWNGATYSDPEERPWRGLAKDPNA